MEESQHAVLDELEWQRENAKLTAAERDHAVTDLIDLVLAVDGILQAQSAADAGYAMSMFGRQLSAEEAATVSSTFLKAYRYQYIVSGLQRTRFPSILFGMLTDTQRARVEAALAPLM
jgi:hypothetical protein